MMPDTYPHRNSNSTSIVHMTDDELEELLRSDAQNIMGVELDIEDQLYAMEALINKRMDHNEPIKSASDAFKEFQQYYMPESDAERVQKAPVKSTRLSKNTSRLSRSLRKAVAFAAVFALVFVGTFTAKACGYDILKAVAIWTRETFLFGESENTAPSEDVSSYQWRGESFPTILKQFNISTSLAPTWIPDRYEMVNLEDYSSPSHRLYLAIYQAGDEILKIQVKNYLTEDPQQIERTDSLTEIYESNGCSYYLFDNHQQMKAAWINGSFECYISGNLTLDELKMMIDSIGKE